jgi:hypothetical protein
VACSGRFSGTRKKIIINGVLYGYKKKRQENSRGGRGVRAMRVKAYRREIMRGNRYEFVCRATG